MAKPFHKRTLEDWRQVLQSDKESKKLIQELIDNCGVRDLNSNFLYRCRLNLKENEINTGNQFDSPPLKMQKKWFNRFLPTTINCLYASSSEKTAILETLSSVARIEDVIFVSELVIQKPLKMINLTNNIYIQGALGETLWNYKPIFAPMFLNEDPTRTTKVFEVTQMLSQKIYEKKLDGIIYPSRSNHLANLKRDVLSVNDNYLIYGSPIRDGKVNFEPSYVKKYRIQLESRK